MKGDSSNCESLRNTTSSENGTRHTADLLYFLGFALWSVSDIIHFSELHNMLPSMLLPLFRFGGIALICISFLLRKFLAVSASRFFLLVIVVFFLAFNNGYLAGDSSWFDIAILIIGSFELDYDLFFFKTALYRSVLNFLLISLAMLNIIPNRLANMSVTRIRFNLGYNWTAYAAHTFLFIVLLFLWYYRKNIKPWLIFTFAIVDYWIYLKTDTKGPFLLVMFVLIVWFIASTLKINYVKSRFIYISTILALPLFSCLIVFLSWHSQKFILLNKLLSNRLQLGNFYINQYGFNWLGHSIFEFNDQTSNLIAYQTIDSSLLRYLIKYGIFSSLVFLVLWIIVCKRIADFKNFYLDLLILILAVEAFSDPWFLAPGYNIFIILVSTLFKKSEREIT